MLDIVYNSISTLMYFAHLDIADIMISPDDFECDRFDMFDMRAMLAAVISLKHITIPSLEKMTIVQV